MKPSVGRLACECCKDIYNQEFQKIVEFRDAGVAIYRYVPQTQNDKLIDTKAEEIFVLRNIGNEDLKLEDFILELGKTNISCPRCVKMIEHAGKLFRNIPKDNIREVTSVCDHCFTRQLLHCPCCEQIVDKFLTFCTDEAQQKEEQRQRVKSWLMKTQKLLKKTFLNVQGNILEPRARSEDRACVTSVDQSRISSARSIPTSKDASKLSSFLNIAREIIVKDESGRIKTKKEPEEETIEPLLKVATFHDSSEELKPVKTKPKSKRMSKLKSHDGDGVPEDIIAPYEKTKRSVSPSKSYSFDTVINSPSETDVSVFSYTFPQEKKITKKPVKGRVSSSELIQNTQQMLQERAEAEKTKLEELRKRREEERKKQEMKKKPKTYGQKKIFAEKPDKERKRSIEITKFIKESSILFPQTKSISSQSLTADTMKHESKSLIQKEVIAEPSAKKAKVVIQKPVIKEKEMVVEPDVMEWLEKSEYLLETLKEPKEKQHEQEEKQKKKPEKIKEPAEKKAKAAENNVEEKQKLIPTEKKIKSTESKSSKSDGPEKKEKPQRIVNKEPEPKSKLEKKPDITATTDLKRQMARQAKAEEAEDKNRKNLEKDREIAEKKAKQVEKPVTPKQIAADSDVEPKKAKSPEKVKEPVPKPKEPEQKANGRKQKVKEPEEKAKKPEQKETVPEKKPKEPQQIPKEPEQKPKELERKPKELEQKPQEPEQKPKELERKPKEPEQKPKELEQKPQEPERTPKELERKPKEQEQKPKEAEQKPKELERKPKEPEQKPKELEQKPQAPERTPKEPEQKAKEPEQTPKEPEKKSQEERQHDIAAANILREQLAEIKKAEIEAEKNKKQHEKEREMAEIKTKEVLKAKFKELMESEIKPPSVSSEHNSLFSGDISEIITKPDEVTDIIIGNKICETKIRDKKCEENERIERQAILTTKQSEKQNHIACKPEQPKQYAKQKSGEPPKPITEVIPKQAEETPKQRKNEQQPETSTNSQKFEQPIPATIIADNKKKLGKLPRKTIRICQGPI